MKWLKELSKLTKHSLNNYKKDTRVGSTHWEEFLWKKDHISSLETHSLTTWNIFWVLSPHFILTIGSRIKPPSCIEHPIPPNGQSSGFALPSLLILELYSHILLLIQPERWLIYGLRKTVLTSSKETIEKQHLGCGSQPLHGTLPSQVSSNCISGMLLHCT